MGAVHLERQYFSDFVILIVLGVFCIWSGTFQGGTKRKCIINDVLKISWNVFSDGEKHGLFVTIWSDTTSKLALKQSVNLSTV